jgi:hypothetical protein
MKDDEEKIFHRTFQTGVLKYHRCSANIILSILHIVTDITSICYSE